MRECVGAGGMAVCALPAQCCAIDYMVHTLDGSSVTLASEKAFPSRCASLSPVLLCPR